MYLSPRVIPRPGVVCRDEESDTHDRLPQISIECLRPRKPCHVQLIIGGEPFGGRKHWIVRWNTQGESFNGEKYDAETEEEDARI